MRDTPPDVEKRLLSMYAEHTPYERLRMAAEMFDTAIILMKAGIKRQHREFTEAQVKGEIFLRMYGDEFSEEEVRCIVCRLTSCM